MKRRHLAFALIAAFLLVLFPLVAGCLTVPGPESTKKTPAVTAIATRTPQTAMATLTPTHVVVRETPARVTTTVPVTAAVSPASGYAGGTCADIGGSVVLPGEQCRGTWLAATNTFSCCSVLPVPVGSGEIQVTITPFDLSVSLDDSPGSITP